MTSDHSSNFNYIYSSNSNSHTCGCEQTQDESKIFSGSTSNHELSCQPNLVSGSRTETPTRSVQACDGSSVIGAGAIAGARALQTCPLEVRTISFQVLRNVVVLA